MGNGSHAVDPTTGSPRPLGGPVGEWFAETYPGGPTPAQALAWPAIERRANLLLVAPTGSGKTLAAFLAILDRLFREHVAGSLRLGLRCVYVSPLRSLGYDVERNLSVPLEMIAARLARARPPVTVGVRTGDTSAYWRRKQLDTPPHLLITTPESLALLLSHPDWRAAFRTVEQVIVDEVHALVPTKRGADLAISLERLALWTAAEPQRIGLSATCRPPGPVAEFLVGPGRTCQVIEAPAPAGEGPPVLEVEALLKPDEAPHRALSYRRLLRRLTEAFERERTTVVFANTRALTEKITHDLRRVAGSPEAFAAHHSALDADRRREVERELKAGRLKAVITSTSLELGVDIGTADLTVLVGLPGSVARCLQRVGRSGHRPGCSSRGLILAATAAELAGAAVTARAARDGRIEPLRCVRAPLDVLCQQLVGMASVGEREVDAMYEAIRRAGPMRTLRREDFDACLAFLAGEMAAPPGAEESEPGAEPRWTAPRIWRHGGRFGIRHNRVIRWYRQNVGTIAAEESVRVLTDGTVVGTLEGAYAERLEPGDRFVLDGRALEFLRHDGQVVQARATTAEADLPRWTSDRQALSPELARELAAFRAEAGRLGADGPAARRAWLAEVYALEPEAIAVLEGLFAAQEALSEIPGPETLLVEESPHPDGYSYAFHAPLSRSACEALGRAVAARLGRTVGRDLALTVADLGWSLRLPDGLRLTAEEIVPLLAAEGLDADILEGIDRGELPARRFRHVAATGLMVLRNPEGGRTRVGGLLWVSRRLYPLVRAVSPDHPLLRETTREILEDLLDAPAARRWLASGPAVRLRCLDAPSPFTAAWIEPGGPEPFRVESPAQALSRLHARLGRDRPA